MKQYIELLQDILDNGKLHHNRTGIDTLAVFGRQIRVPLGEGFPILTTKKLWFKGIVAELFWYLKGDCNLKFLQEHNVKIWNAWANEKNEIVNCYPKQWRKWEHMYWPKYNPNNVGSGPNEEQIDQVARLVERIKTDPNSRRLIISAWNPADEDTASLPWCQSLVQFNVYDNKLGCHLYMRSSDIFLGLPWNIAFYALFTHMVAQVCELDVDELIVSFGNLHLYTNHVEQAKEQLTRKPMKLPELWLNPEIKDIDSFKFEDIKLVNYVSHPAIKSEVAV